MEQSEMTDRIYLNDDWYFTEHFTEQMLQDEYREDVLEKVRLPHTVKETPFHYFDEQIYQMVSGYRKRIFVPDAWNGKRVLLTVDGAAHDSEVYWNGKTIGKHHCGYTAFTIDVTEYLEYGRENFLVIRVDSNENCNIPPFGFVVDYMTYGGLYREVWLEVKEEQYLADVFCHSQVDVEATEQILLSEITVHGQSRADLHIRQSIRPLSKEERSDAGFLILGEMAVTTEKLQLQFAVKQVELWDVEHPFCYEVKTELLRNGEIIDVKRIVTGFRLAEFKEDGFYLNGRKLKLRGLNRHQSYPYVGYAMPESMQRMDAAILKQELGLNAVRTSHYPQSHYFLDECDRQGLLVFTEIPGWQHIGDADWKEQAVENVKDMVLQYRNHVSIILWGVRINESVDDDAFYERTNAAAHEADSTRPTGGVRAHKKSSLLEDVYTYNDFVHDGKNRGCEKKANVTSDRHKPYLISEYNGHMYPTKAFDWEEHRAEHAMRHVRVLDAVAGEQDIAGSFGWCMFDYNTHKDFGSGDRICYHGVMDMFRNPKLAADVYASQQEERPVLSLSSSMDIGEHPGCNRGETYLYTNADSVRMYKNDRFIKEYRREDSPYKNMLHGPLLIDDYIGNAIAEGEDFAPGQEKGIKEALNAAARFGLSNLPKSIYLTALKLMLVYHMKPDDAVGLYNKYVGDWGGTSTKYRFEAIKDSVVVKVITKEPMHQAHLVVETDHQNMVEKSTYDVAALRITVRDENENILPFFSEPVMVETEGPVEVIGPLNFSLKGGMGGTYIKTTGVEGNATVTLKCGQTEIVQIEFSCQIKNM
jgi:beta-galactosidase